MLFGAPFEVNDCDEDKKQTYQIVGQYEANLEKGLISMLSPLAKALIGRCVGDFVEFNTPKGLKTYEILSVKFI